MNLSIQDKEKLDVVVTNQEEIMRFPNGLYKETIKKFVKLIEGYLSDPYETIEFESFWENEQDTIDSFVLLMVREYARKKENT